MLTKVREGKTVREASELFGVATRTIYEWLAKNTDGGGSGLSLENSKLKRENHQLKQIIGELMLTTSRGKKG